MKRIWILLAILCVSLSASYAKKIEGYYITNVDDTIKCTFLVSYDLLTQELNYAQFQYKIKYIDSNGAKQKFYPGDIKAFVLHIESREIIYLSRKNDIAMQSLFSTNEHIFLKLRIDGPLKMFDYFISRQGGGGYNATTGGFTPGMSYVEESYCLQKGNDRLTYIRWISFKKDLSNYLSDYPELAQKILDKEYKKGDIDTIVKEYNQWMNVNIMNTSKNGF